MNDKLLKKITNRANVISSSYKKVNPDDRIKKDLPNRNVDMLYKHLSRYSAVEWNDDVEKYAVLTGVWQEYLVQKYLKDANLKNIPCTLRAEKGKVLFVKQRKSNAKSVPEKVQCKKIKEAANNTCLGEILDFQVPLKASRDDCKGELDMVSKVGDSTMQIIEYKTPDSNEPLLRAVLEAITYYYQIDGASSASKYLADFNRVFETDCKKIAIAIVVPEHIYRFGHSKAFDLIREYAIDCFTFADANYDTSIKPLKKDELFAYEKISAQNMRIVTENSQLIMSLINI